MREAISRLIYKHNIDTKNCSPLLEHGDFLKKLRQFGLRNYWVILVQTIYQNIAPLSVHTGEKNVLFEHDILRILVETREG
jgi:hypothetical protein